MPNVTEERLHTLPERDRDHQRRVLRVAKMVSATVGRSFFQSLTEHLAKALGADCVYVAELVEGRVPKLRAIAVYRDGAVAPEFEQELLGTSASQVLTDGFLAWSRDVRRIFPADPLLQELLAEGAVGIRLTDSVGTVTGIIALVGRAQLRHIAVTRAVMEAFASRASAELERKRADDLLRESEQRYRAFITRSSDAMWRIELATPVPLDAPEEEQVDRIYRDGYLAECNDALAVLVGARSAQELIGSQFSSLFSPADQQIREEIRAAVRERYRSSTTLSFQVSGGRPGHRLRTQFGVVENGELRRIWGTTRDITELKNAELAVEASERRFREVLENIHLPALMLNGSGEITFGNAALARAADSADGLVGRNWREFVHDPCERKTWTALLSKKFADSDSQRHFEGVLRFGEGTPRLMVWDAIVLRDATGEGTGLAAIGRDVSEQRVLEARLAQAAKLEGIGRLAGGIAHDFNNLLTLILGHVESGIAAVHPEMPVYESLAGIQSAATDCSVLTQQLLAIGRTQLLRPELLDLNSLIDAENDTLNRIVGPHIALCRELEPCLGRVWADRLQIRRVLSNLASNSRDAMPEGGTLTIATANVTIAGDLQSYAPAVPPGNYIRLTVSDTGVGLSDDIKRHLFEPFFTTKPAGKGVGLGLTTVYGIVSQSDGYVFARSPGVGTVIEVLLPCRHESPAPLTSSS